MQGFHHDFKVMISFSRNPTPPVDYESIIDFKWLPVNDTTHINYLNIDGNFTQLAEPEPGRVRFWDRLYETYAPAEP